jgi:hypothetical protein
VRVNSLHSSSFRDPSGYIFIENGILKRVINPLYFKQYFALKDSGFYNKLFQAALLVPHTELSADENAIVIRPEKIPFITYPYEWCFNQYKESALLTLRLQKYCLENGFSLKDASAYNITFHKGKAVFIDTLSIDFYVENMPWRAYKQFVAHFLGPLLLARYYGSEMLKLITNYYDGLPIKLIASLLPIRAKLNPFIYSNVHLLAKFEEKHREDYQGETNVSSLSKKAQLNIIRSLYAFIKKLNLKESSEWGNYYEKTNYTDEAFTLKSGIINGWIDKLQPRTLIDVGGNDGTFVRMISSKTDQALVCDIDNNAVDHNYRTIRKNKEQHITPFVLDVLNPSAAIGINNKERFSFLHRIKDFGPDVTLALALIHHMSLSGNVPFEMSAKFFAAFSKYLIIEFPQRNDSWVTRLLEIKAEFKEHFDFYNIENFEKIYSEYFEIRDKQCISVTNRVIYLLKRTDVY